MSTHQKNIVIAGATGNLGMRISKALRANNATVRAIVRNNSDPKKVQALKDLGVEVHLLDLQDTAAMSKVCADADCVVSALSGLSDVIIDTQKKLLDAAVLAKVPRFIPSDFSLDFRGFSAGSNRNLDLRREFHQYLDKQPIAATTIFNGAFMDMLTGEMPLILFNINRILAWGNPNQGLDFTTIDNTATYTAHAALDEATPRYLCIAGDQFNARELADTMTGITGKKHGLLRPGGLGFLGFMIKMARTFAPGKDELYPAWQGMQYMHNMVDGRGFMKQRDNARYSMKWTSAKELLEVYHQKE